MYSRAEASRLKHNFWIAFGRYLSVIPNSEGLRINWVNYHTGYKNVYFRMDADQRKAYIGIQLTHPDQQSREQFFERLSAFRSIFEDALGEKWNWQKNTMDAGGKQITSIYRELPDVNVFDEKCWPEIISFLKPRIIALDSFWNDVKDGFEDLR